MEGWEFSQQGALNLGGKRTRPIGTPGNRGKADVGSKPQGSPYSRVRRTEAGERLRTRTILQIREEGTLDKTPGKGILPSALRMRGRGGGRPQRT